MGSHTEVPTNILTRLGVQGHSIEWLAEQTNIDVNTLNRELHAGSELTFFHAILIAFALQTSTPALLENDATVTAHELAATELRCSVQKVYRMAREGDIPGIKVGRSWRFVIDDVRKALAHTTVDPWVRKNPRRWTP